MQCFLIGNVCFYFCKLHFEFNEQEKPGPAAGIAGNGGGLPALPLAQEQPASACISAGSNGMLALTAGQADMSSQNQVDSVEDKQAAATDAGNAGKPSLEDFEKEAFQAVQAKKSAKKVLKRPAAQESSQAAAGPEPAGKKLKLGCKKCRGTPKGCPQCRNPNYAGQRLSREEWRALAEKHGLK